jgi:purine nucleosidase
VQIHVDTDFGGDPDDAAAVAMLLGWPGVEVVGVTTNLEVEGQRAGCAQHYLRLAGRGDVPVAAGASSTLTGGRYVPTWGDDRYWPTPVMPTRTAVSRPGAALDLLAANVEAGATVLAIGALTNLALVEVLQPGCLAGARVVAMGGWFELSPPGWPRWGPDMDFNIQADARAAEIVLGSDADITFVPMATAMQAQLRTVDLVALRSAGPVGELLTRQSLAYAHDAGMAALAAKHE